MSLFVFLFLINIVGVYAYEVVFMCELELNFILIN